MFGIFPYLNAHFLNLHEIFDIVTGKVIKYIIIISFLGFNICNKNYGEKYGEKSTESKLRVYISYRFFRTIIEEEVGS